jgi:cell wall-associated NlpC family hydrolase
MKNCVFKMWIVERINPAVAPTPVTPAVTPDGKLVEDGVGGKATAKAMQRFFGTPQDGMLGGQSKAQQKYYTAMTAVKYGKGGSPCVKAMQKWLGVAQDGVWGKATSKALQKKLGVKEDGFFGRASMKAWQKYLNTHDKAVYPIKPKKAKDNGDKVADMAESYIGKSKYVKGGTHIKTGVDCTGFVQEMYRLALGIKLPASLSAWGKSIGTDISKAQRGDIISYRNKSDHKLRHHAIYVGNKKVVHASGSHTNHKKDIIKSGYNFDGMYVEGIRRRWK